ncbi:MAG: YnbE family lipoprotein [Gammaproteobacteria bacterium]|nr:YnbE family lipoprotein [Gammaproteobacteria bacterium]
MQRRLPLILTAILPVIISGAMLTGCTPSVKVEAPDKPITINLNVKIEHEIRVKVDRELEDVFSEDSGLF